MCVYACVCGEGTCVSVCVYLCVSTWLMSDSSFFILFIKAGFGLYWSQSSPMWPVSLASLPWGCPHASGGWNYRRMTCPLSMGFGTQTSAPQACGQQSDLTTEPSPRPCWGRWSLKQKSGKALGSLDDFDVREDLFSFPRMRTQAMAADGALASDLLLWSTTILSFDLITSCDLYWAAWQDLKWESKYSEEGTFGLDEGI